MGWQLAPATTFTKQKLQFSTINIKEPGYLFTYLSYDDDSDNWVFFDDFKVTHTKTNVLQYNEYYPFGLKTNSSWTRDNSKNNLLYNDASELNELTSFYDLAFRQYDPTIGRFLQVDPLADVTESFSPYQYARNNPVLLNDPLGLTDNVMLMEAMCLCGGQEYAVSGGGRGLRYYTPWHGISGPEIYSEAWGGYVSALEIMNYDPTYQNLEYRERAHQAIRDYLQVISLDQQENLLQQQDPLQQSNGERVWTIKEFYEANKGLTRDQIINQRRSQGPGQPGGPTMRYVRNPRDGNVIDMRHMLIVGPLGPIVGGGVEVAQWMAGQPSGMNPQDFYSNNLGLTFNGYKRLYKLGDRSMYSDYLYNFFTTDHYYNKKN